MRPLRLTLAALLLAAVTELQAVPLTFSYAALITQVNLDPGDALVGSTLSGSYTFDPDAANDASDPSFGSYTMTGPPFGMTAIVAGASFATTDFLNITAAVGADGIPCWRCRTTAG